MRSGFAYGFVEPAREIVRFTILALDEETYEPVHVPAIFVRAEPIGALDVRMPVRAEHGYDPRARTYLPCSSSSFKEELPVRARPREFRGEIRMLGP